MHGFWFWEQPARRLPITLAPAHRETVISYVARLARVNGLDPIHLLEHVGRVRSRWVPYREARLSASAVQRLLTLSGQPPASLHRALPALAAATDTPLTPFVGHYTPAADHQAFPACRRCTAHHPGGTVTAYLASHWQLCARHDRWQQRLDRLDGVELASHQEPTIRAVSYPETVTVAGLLACPSWTVRVVAYDHGIFHEAGRRLGIAYPATGVNDPLNRWCEQTRTDHALWQRGAWARAAPEPMTLVPARGAFAAPWRPPPQPA